MSAHACRLNLRRESLWVAVGNSTLREQPKLLGSGTSLRVDFDSHLQLRLIALIGTAAVSLSPHKISRPG